MNIIKRKGSIKLDRDGAKLFLIALPFIVLVFMFSYVPLFGWVYSLFNYKPGIALSNTAFVGFKNFIEVAKNWVDVSRVLKNTLGLGFLNILVSPLPVIVAVLLNEVRYAKFKKVVQITTTIPNFISWVIVFGMTFSIFSSEGLLNSVLLKMNLIISPANIIGNPDIVWQFQTALSIWKGLGWNCIIYLAAIACIDEELYGAAKVDGAGRFRCMWHITVPELMPTFVVLLLLSISNILGNGFEQYFVFRNSMVQDNIEVLDLYVYRLGIVTNQYSYAITIGMLKSVVSIILLFAANNIAKKIRGQSII